MLDGGGVRRERSRDVPLNHKQVVFGLSQNEGEGTHSVSTLRCESRMEILALLNGDLVCFLAWWFFVC